MALATILNRLGGKLDLVCGDEIGVGARGLDRIYVTDGDEGALKIFDGKDYKPLDSVPLAKDADSIGYEPARRYPYVINGGKDAGKPYSLVSVIDTTANHKIAEIRVEGETVEAMALDLYRPRMYVNNRSRNEVAVVDRFKQAVTASWPVTMGKDNVAMAHQRLFVGCRSGHVVVFDSNTGKELKALPIAKGIDDLEYDASSKRLYAVGGGTVDVYQEIDADRFEALDSVAAGGQAKTACLVPSINRYFVAVPQTGEGTAAVQVFQPLNAPAFKLLKPLSPNPCMHPGPLNLIWRRFPRIPISAKWAFMPYRPAARIA